MKTHLHFKNTSIFYISIICLFAVNQHMAAVEKPASAYIWKSVEMVGGGFVPGIVFHPKAKNVCYCRTDMGGAYRRNVETMRWESLLDWLKYEDANLMGVESIALDPSNPEFLYLACGTYTNARTPNGAILRSDDRGKTFKRTDVPFKMGGNEDGRGNGERMAVDPNNGNIILFGTRHDGLWLSTDRSVTWNKVSNFPDITETPPAYMQNQDSILRWRRANQGSGIVFAIFDPKSGKNGKNSSTIIVGASLMNRENLFRSVDGGKTWKAIPGQPTSYRPTHAVLGSDGSLYVTYGNAPGPSEMTDGAVWKLNTKTNVWTNITPDKPNPQNRAFGYAAISVDAGNPKTIIASSYHRYGIEKGDELFRSTDGGKTWKKVFGSGGFFDNAIAPYVGKTGIHWLFDIEIDPNNPDHAMFTTGYGGHETYNLTDIDKGKPTKWTVMSAGIEETVALELHSPTSGAPLMTAIGDYGGFVHWDLDKSQKMNFANPIFGNTNGISSGDINPNIVVRVGRATNNNNGKSIGYSLDGGKTWQPTKSIPNEAASLGHIAVSADGKTWIWAPEPVRNRGGVAQPMMVYYTIKKGESWNECKGIPGNTRVVADKVNPLKFYAINLFEGKFYFSTDGGVNFTEQPLLLTGGVPARGNRGDIRGGQDRIYATPGKEGELWIAAFDGLHHSTDSGKSFVKFGSVKEIHAFGFGKAMPGANYSALYLIGIVDGVRGIFRSDDIAENWIRINDDEHQWGLLLHVTGDPKQYGRVYVGTHGRGTLYGDPVNANQLKPDFEKPKEIKGMKLVWNEEFNTNGKPDSASWSHEIGFVRNQEMQWYQPDNAVCKDGLLIIEGKREQFDNPNYQAGSSNWKNNRQKVNYTSSSINTRGKKDWLYGRFEVRARIDSSMGSWPAIWTLGIDKQWPSNGEIDMMEFYRVNNDPTILANVAWGTNQRYVAKWDGDKRHLKYFTNADPDWVKKFHVWRMDWDKDNIKLYLDDVLLNICPLTQTINPDGSNPFNKPQYILLNLALGSNGGDPVNTPFPLKFEVDYVRVYQE